MLMKLHIDKCKSRRKKRDTHSGKNQSCLQKRWTLECLGILAAAGIYRRNPPVPSWVPDFTHPEVHYPFAVLDEDCYHETGHHLFNAGGQVPEQPILQK